MKLLTAALLALSPAAASGGSSSAEAENPADAPPARVLSDFDDDADREAWYMVNDDVMGGRSEGGVAFDGGVLVFLGDINTNGGGFSSTRRDLVAGTLEGADRVVLRVLADDRPYRLQLMDDTREDDGLIHRADLALDPEKAGQWQTVTVRLADMVPSLRGDPVEGPVLDPARTTRVGLMLNDTRDGPFELRVDWMHAEP